MSVTENTNIFHLKQNIREIKIQIFNQPKSHCIYCHSKASLYLANLHKTAELNIVPKNAQFTNLKYIN